MSDFGEGGAEGTAASWVGRDAELRMYRLNRRSPVEQSLFGEPDGWDDQDAFDHFWHILSSAEPVVRSYQGNERLWALGDVSRQETPAGEFVIGTLGFERLGSERDSTYDEVRRTWVTSAEERHISEVVPIIVDAENPAGGRVVAHREFRPNTVSVVLTRILRDAEERARQYSATRWSVEPVESSQALYDWLARTPRVMVLTLVLRLPNPDAPESLDGIGIHVASVISTVGYLVTGPIVVSVVEEIMFGWSTGLAVWAVLDLVALGRMVAGTTEVRGRQASLESQGVPTIKRNGTES